MPRPILYFARHGETDWNRERRLQGQHDIPLNALGRVQASRCGELLRELLERDGRPAGEYDYVSSPLGRARETMELMRAAMGLDPEAYRTDARLMEMSFGRWEGFTFAELQTREAAALAERERDKWGFVLPGGESYAQLEVRVARLVRERRARHRGVGAWRGVPGADRASQSGGARGGFDRRYRAGLRLRVRRQQHGAPRVSAARVAHKSKTAGLSSSRSAKHRMGISRI